MPPVKIMIRFLSFYIICLLAGCGGGSGEPPEELKNLSPNFPVLSPVASTLEETLDNYLNKNQAGNAAGISILVRKSGQVVYHKSRGMANINSSLVVDNSTGFHVAALSKTFTALAIMQLYEQGQLQLDASILDYLPELPPNWENITIDMMLTHRSGMYDYIMDLDDDALSSFTNQQVINYFRLNPLLKFSPGSETEYNNTAYIFLAEIIERVSGMDFSQYLQTAIFSPAAMTDSYINDNTFPLKTKDALNYAVRDDWFGTHIYTHGDNNQVSSTNDLNAFFDALASGKIISQDSLYLMAYPHTFLNQQAYGYGLIIDGDIDSQPRISHGGSRDSYNSILVIDPVYGIEYAILACNGERSSADLRNIRYLIERFYSINE